MKRTLLFAIVATLLLIGLILYRSRDSGSRLQVEPHAREEIEKARRR